jgi:hypothetical protein
MDLTTHTYREGGFDPAKPDSNVAAVTSATLDATSANARQIETASRSALAQNKAFLALASPTNADVLAQVKALTRQMNGVIRLLLGQLDDAS